MALLAPLHVLYAQYIAWEKPIIIPGGLQRIQSVEILDNSIYCAGNLNSDQGQLIKLDSGGNEVWRRNFNVGGYPKSTLYHILKVKDEPNFYVFGRAFFAGGGPDVVAKIDSIGDTLWTKYYTELGIYSTVRACLQLDDKSIVIAGVRQTPNGVETIAKRIDSLGNTLWEESYPYSNLSEGWGITEMLDGSMVISGGSNGNNVLYKIRFNGELIKDTLISGTGVSGIRNNIFLFHGNRLILTSDAYNGSWYNSQQIILDDRLNIIFVENGVNGILNDLVVFDDSSFSIENYHLPDSTSMNWFDNLNSNVSAISFPVNGTIREIYDFSSFKSTDLICVGYVGYNNNTADYWISKISNAGEEWIPDRCSYQPPVAGFEYEYNYPVLTLRDTSSGGLKYLDTVYTWQWTTSVGFSGSDDSLIVLFDSAINKTLDIELVISNWYGCTDTVNQTLVFGETGIESLKEFTISIYPNPAKDKLCIEFDQDMDHAVFRLFDLQGRLQFQNQINQESASISITSLPIGLYIYEIQSGERFKRGKVVKE